MLLHNYSFSEIQHLISPKRPYVRFDIRLSGEKTVLHSETASECTLSFQVQTYKLPFEAYTMRIPYASVRIDEHLPELHKYLQELCRCWKDRTQTDPEISIDIYSVP